MTEQNTEDKVPATAAAIVDLLNSREFAIYTDKLDEPDLAAGILRRFDPAANGGDVDELRALRSSLLAIVQADGAAETEWADFTARTSAVTLRHDFSTPGAVSLHQASGDPVVGKVALDVAQLVSAGSWSRIRLCANHECERAFYDTTRSRTQRWHSYEICGNRANVAAFRARGKTAADA
jgi:predicted RNA-binding Zn ribbon-like protein